MSTITLKYPVTVENQETKSLTLRRPKVRDMLVGEKQGSSDAEREVYLFANLAEVSPAVVQELDMADYGQVQETYKGFLSLVPSLPEKAALS